MKSNFALGLAGAIANALGAAAAPALMSGPARMAAAGPTVVTNTHWSGAVYNGQGVTDIEATFVIPDISGQSSQDSVAVWVGIDGATSGSCGNTLMQAGILLYGDGGIQRKWCWDFVKLYRRLMANPLVQPGMSGGPRNPSSTGTKTGLFRLETAFT